MVPVNTLPPRSDMETVSGVADAAARNDTDALQRLVEAGTPVNIRDSSTGLFPLAIACSSGHVEAAKVLLQSGAKIGNGDEEDVSQTALHAAARQSGTAVRTLLSIGTFNVNSRDRLGLTPLHDAACEGKSDAVRALLDAGATVSLDRYGKSPLHYAAESGFMDVISMLLTAAPVASPEVSVNSSEPSQTSRTPTEPSAPSARDSLTTHTTSDEPAASRVVARHRDSAGAHGVGSASGSGIPLDVLAGGRPSRGHARGLATAPRGAQRGAVTSGHRGPSSVSADDGDDDQDEYDEDAEDEEGSSSGLMTDEEFEEEEEEEEGAVRRELTAACKADGQRIAIAGASRRVHGGRQGLAHASALAGSTERGVRARTPQPAGSGQPPLPANGAGQAVMARAGAAGRQGDGDLPSLVSEAQALVSRAEAELGTFEAAVHDALDMRLDNDAFLEMAEKALADTGGKLAGTLSALQKARKAAGREVGRAAASLASLPPIQALAEEVAASRRCRSPATGLAPAAAAAPAGMRVEQLDEESDGDGEEDRNMDVCAVCGDYGELLICECCPRAFHLQCLGLTHLPSDDPWYCGRCDEPLDEKLAVMMLEAARKKADEAHRASLSDQAADGRRLVARRGRLVQARGHDAADGLAAEYGTDEEDGLYGDEADGSLGPDGIADGLEEEVVSADEAGEHSTIEAEEGDSQGTLEIEPEPHMADPITLGNAVNSRDSTGRTPLFYAVLKGRLGALRALVASGADVHCTCDDGKGLLHTAALGGYVATITACIALGLDPNCRDSTGQTPLYCASEKGNVQAVRALISAGAEVNASDNGDNGVTPLRRAAACGHIAVIDALVSAGADVDWCSRTGNNALHDAAWNGRSDAVRALVQRGASLQARDNHNWTALHYAADHGRTDAIVALISLGAEVSAKTKDRWTPLRLAAKGGHVEAVRALLGSKAKFLVDDEEENYKQSPLHAAARLRDSNERHSTVNTLIAAGADLSSRDKEGWTPVHCAAANGHADTLHALIRAGADVDGVDNHGLSPLREAAAAGHTAAVAALLEAGSDVNAKCKQGYTPLHDASWQGRADAVQALLKHGADPRAKASDGRTALHCASQRGHVPVTELLLPLFSALEVTTHDREGWTPLHRAAQEGHTAVVEMLLKHGAQVNAVHMYSSTALHEASAKGDVKTVSVLLGAGGDVHLTDHLGYTPLHSAAGNVKKNGAVVLLLLVAGASVNHKAADGQTALHIAAKQGNFDAVDVLVRWGADAHARDQERRSPMDVSSGAQVKKLLRLLRSGASGGPSIVNGPLPSGGAFGNVDLKTFLARQGDVIDVLAADAPGKVTGTNGKKGKKGSSASSNAMVPASGSGSGSSDTSPILSFDLQEVLAATDFFAAKSAGKGIYGSLYDCTLRGMPVVVKRVQLDPDTLQSAQPVSLHAHITAEMNTSKAIAATIAAAAAASTAVTAKTDAGLNGGVHPDIPALLQSVRHLIGFCSVAPSQGGGQHSRVLLALVYAVPKDAMLDNWAQLDRQAVEMEARSASEAAELAAQAAEAELLALTLDDEPTDSNAGGKGGAKNGSKGSKGKVAKKDSKASADAAADAAARLAVAKAEQEAKAKAAAVAAAALATKPAASVQASKPSSNVSADAKAVLQPTATVKMPAGSAKVKQSKIGRTLTDRLEQVALVPDSPSKNKAVKAAVAATRTAAIAHAEPSMSGVAGNSSAHPKGGSTGSTSPPLPATTGAVVVSRGSDSDTATHGTAGTSTSSVTASAVPPGTPTSRRGPSSQTVQGKSASSSATVQAALAAKPPSTPSRKTTDQGTEQRAVAASVNITPPRVLLKKDAAVPVAPVPVPAAGGTAKAGKGKGKGVGASVDSKPIKAALPVTGKGQAAAPAATGSGPWSILPKGAPSHATDPSVANGGTAGPSRQAQNRGSPRVGAGTPSRSGATAAGRDTGAPYALSADSDAWAPAGPPASSARSGSGPTGAAGMPSIDFRASASMGSGLNASANDFMPRTAADGSGPGTLSPARMSVRALGSSGPAAAPATHSHGGGPMQHGSAVQQHVAPMANPASVATALAMQLLANSAGSASAPSAAAAALALGAAAAGGAHVQSSGGVPVFPFGSATFDPNLMAATMAAAAAAQAQALGVQAHVQAVSAQHHSMPSSAAGPASSAAVQGGGMLLQGLPGPAGVNDGSGAYSTGNGMVHYGSAPPSGPGSYGMHGSYIGGGGHVSVGPGATLQGMQVGLMQQGMRQGMQTVNTMPVPGLTGPMSQHSSHAPGGTGQGSSRTGAGHGPTHGHGHHLQQGNGAASSPQNGSGFDADQELDQLVTDIIAE